MVWNVGYNALGEIFVWYEAAILSSTLYFVNSSLMLSSFSANKDTFTAILMQWTSVDNCDLASFTAYTMYCCNAKVWIHTNKFTDSITSKKTSFLRYLTPSPLQDTAFVKATGGLGAPTSNLWPSWVIYLINKVHQEELKIWYKRNSLPYKNSLREHILVMFVVVQTLCWPRRCCLWSQSANYQQDT